MESGGGGSFAPGTGDFNFDWWFNIDSVGYEQNMFDTRATVDGASGFQIDFHPSYGLLFYSALGGGIQSAGVTPSVGVWHHFEVSRTGTTARMFLDGVQITSWTDTNNYANSQAYLGGVTYTPLGAVPMTAYFDEFRCLIGKGGHTANFIPPTAPYSDT